MEKDNRKLYFDLCEWGVMTIDKQAAFCLGY